MKRFVLFMGVAAMAVGAVSPTEMFANGRVASGNRWGEAGSHRHKPKAQYEDITAVNEGAKTVTIGHKNGKDHSENGGQGDRIQVYNRGRSDGHPARLETRHESGRDHRKRRRGGCSQRDPRAVEQIKAGGSRPPGAMANPTAASRGSDS